MVPRRSSLRLHRPNKKGNSFLFLRTVALVNGGMTVSMRWFPYITFFANVSYLADRPSYCVLLPACKNDRHPSVEDSGWVV